MKSQEDITPVRNSERRVIENGTTCSGASSRGRATAWELSLPGRPLLTVHDTEWENGERDLVLHKPTVVPEMPLPLSNLHNRLRTGISSVERRRELRMMMWPAYVDPKTERPRIHKSVTTANLAARVGLRHLQEIAARKDVTLEPAFGQLGKTSPKIDLDHPQDERAFQHALFFPAEDDKTPVAVYVRLRIVPVLRHIGWL